MERTNKKFFGIAAIAVVAIVVALMFSYFANAVPEVATEATPATAELAATQSNDTTKVTLNTPDPDAFGNESVKYSINGSSEWVTSIDLDIETTWKYMFYYDNTTESSTGQPASKVAATLIFFASETQLAEFKTAEENAKGSGTGALKVRFEKEASSYSNCFDGLYLYKSTDRATHISPSKHILDTIKNWNYQFLPSTGDLLKTLGTTFGTFAENEKDKLNLEVTGELFGSIMPLAKFVKEADKGDKFEDDFLKGVYHGATVHVDAANSKFYLKDATPLNKTNLTYETYLGVYRLDFLSAGVKTQEMYAYNTETSKHYDNTFTFTNNKTSIFASVATVEYSVDGVKYKIISLDKLKEIVNNIPETEKTPYIQAIKVVLNSLPTPLAAVSGLEDDCPADIDIPNVISVDDYPGYEFLVSAVLPNALSGDSVTSVTFPVAMRAFFADCCTGLTNLKSVTFKDNGHIFIPDVEKFANFEIDVTLVETGEKVTTTLLSALIATKTNLIVEKPAELLSVYAKGELVKERAFSVRMIASIWAQVSQEDTLNTVVANDNFYYGYDAEKTTTEWMNMRGTFETCPEVSKFAGEDIMFGTGTFSSVILNEYTDQPVVNAKVTFTDELGRTHETTTNQFGVFTIDNLYQTASLLKEYSAKEIKFPFHYRKFTIEADNYKTTVFDEEEDAPVTPGEDPYPVWDIGCYSYYNPMLTSDVIYENGFEMTQTSISAYLASAINTNFVADVAAGSTLSGANVQIYQANQSGAQKFVFEPQNNENGDFVISIKNAQSGKYLDVCGGVAANYTNVQQYDGNGTDAQKWVLKHEGDFIVLHSAIDQRYVLDLNAGDASNGQNLQLFEANGSAAQQFRLIECTPAVPAGDFDLVDGIYVIRTRVNNDNVLDVQWGSKDDGANVWAYDYAAGNTNQMWEVKQVAWGYYTIKNVNTGKYLDVAGCDIMPGANVWQYSENGTAAQQWAISKVEQNGDIFYQLVNVGSGLTLDVAGAGTKSGTNVHGYFDNDSIAQQFYFEHIL